MSLVGWVFVLLLLAVNLTLVIGVIVVLRATRRHDESIARLHEEARTLAAMAKEHGERPALEQDECCSKSDEAHMPPE